MNFLLYCMACWVVGEVDGLKMKQDEEISAPIKIAILVGMLPKDYQDMCLQQATGVSADSEVRYIELRDRNHEHSKPTNVYDYPNTHGY